MGGIHRFDEVVKHSSNGLKGVIGALQGILKLKRLCLVKVDLLFFDLGGVSLRGGGAGGERTVERSEQRKGLERLNVTLVTSEASRKKVILFK